MQNSARSLVTALALLAVACSQESIAPVDEQGTPQHLTGPFVVSGKVTAPGGADICTLVSPSVGASVRIISPGGTALSTKICWSGNPTNSYALPPVAPGTYYLMVGIGATSTSLPWRYLDPATFGVAADMVRDVQVQYGSALRGGATLDGTPVAGIGLMALYDQVPNWAAANLASSAAGGWDEPAVGRNPALLQNDLYYLFSGCSNVLAANLATPLPSAPVLFPGGGNSLTCSFLTNTASDRTHFSNRLVVTADAGDFGAQSPPQMALRGQGWGVQFPVGASGPRHLPPNATQLWRGGLMLGFSPDKVLSAVTLDYGPCGPSCMDFDVSGPPVITPGSPGKVIAWRYDDATSPEGEGIRVTQRSYDGSGDFVLFQFIIRNTSPRTRTFWAGNWMDWDLDLDPSDDGVETDLGGRLMYSYSGMTFQSNVPSGNHLGSMMLGQPVSGNYAWATSSFYCQGSDPRPDQQVAALSGALVALSQTTPTCDKRYIHGAGPITLPPGHQTDLWIPIVAGTDKAEMLTAATAAESWWQQHGQRATIGIDILPGSATNPINTKKSGLVPVAILGGPSFDAARIDFTTLVLGPSGAPPVHNLSDPKVFADHLQDVNRDGYTDLVTHYQQQDAGLSPGATQACVNGVTITGTVFDGCDVVQVK